MTESFTFFFIGTFITKIFWLSNLCCIICLCDHSKKKSTCVLLVCMPV